MAAGDVKSNLQQVALGNFLDLKPSAGEEWVIHNIGHGGSVELYFSDGTNNILVDSSAGSGSWAAYYFHCTSARYYRVKNVDAGSIYISYDGVQTK